MSLDLRRAVVAAISPLTIYVGGSAVAVPARRVDSYAPAVGDQVSVLENGPDLLIVGSLGIGTATWSPGFNFAGTAFAGTQGGKFVRMGAGMIYGFAFAKFTGGATNFGAFGFNLPVAHQVVVAGELYNYEAVIGWATAIKAGVGNVHNGFVKPNGSTTAMYISDTDAIGSPSTATTWIDSFPLTWGANDEVHVTVMYLAA